MAFKGYYNDSPEYIDISEYNYFLSSPKSISNHHLIKFLFMSSYFVSR